MEFIAKILCLVLVGNCFVEEYAVAIDSSVHKGEDENYVGLSGEMNTFEKNPINLLNILNNNVLVNETVFVLQDVFNTLIVKRNLRKEMPFNLILGNVHVNLLDKSMDLLSKFFADASNAFENVGIIKGQAEDSNVALPQLYLAGFMKVISKVMEALTKEFNALLKAVVHDLDVILFENSNQQHENGTFFLNEVLSNLKLGHIFHFNMNNNKADPTDNNNELQKYERSKPQTLFRLRDSIRVVASLLDALTDIVSEVQLTIMGNANGLSLPDDMLDDTNKPEIRRLNDLDNEVSFNQTIRQMQGTLEHCMMSFNQIINTIQNVLTPTKGILKVPNLLQNNFLSNIFEDNLNSTIELPKLCLTNLNSTTELHKLPLSNLNSATELHKLQLFKNVTLPHKIFRFSEMKSNFPKLTSSFLKMQPGDLEFNGSLKVLSSDHLRNIYKFFEDIFEFINDFVQQMNRSMVTRRNETETVDNSNNLRRLTAVSNENTENDGAYLTHGVADAVSSTEDMFTKKSLNGTIFEENTKRNIHNIKNLIGDLQSLVLSTVQLLTKKQCAELKRTEDNIEEDRQKISSVSVFVNEFFKNIKSVKLAKSKEYDNRN